MSTPQVIPKNRTVHLENYVEIIECCVCSIDFGLGVNFLRNRRRYKDDFYCPNGHVQGFYGPNAEERARKKAEEERDAARSLAEHEARRRRQAEEEARRQDYRARAAKGALTRERKRIAMGVCPCCRRSFKQVRAHIASQHPDYVIPAGA